MTGGRSLLALPAALLLVAGVAVPLAILIVISFWSVDFDSFELVPGLGLASWREVLGNPTYPFLIGKAVLTGLVTVALTAVLGYPVALSLLSLPAAWKGVAITVLMTPLYTGEIVRIYAWRLVLGTDGLVNGVLLGLHLVREPVKILLFSPFSTVLALVYDELPFMVLALWIAAERLDLRLVEAARDLGARPLQAFFRVTLPLTSPGFCAGALAVFALAAGDMQTPNFLGGPSGATALASIDNFFGTAFDWPTASALALALLAALAATAALLAFAILRIGWRRPRLAPASSSLMRRAALVLGAATVFLYLPIAVLAVFSFNASKLMAFPLSGFTLDWYRSLAGNTKFQSGFVTSFLVAQSVGLLSAGFGLTAALALTSAPRLVRGVLASLLLAPFLVPKTVLSIAQSMVLARLGLERGAIALIAAETIVALPFAAALIAAVLARLDPRLVEAARDLGATPWMAFRRVTFPQIKPAVTAAYSIGVILSLADLTVSLYLAGRTQPLSLVVASEFRRELSPDLNAMQVSVLGLTAVIVILTEVYGRVRVARRRRGGAPLPEPLQAQERAA